MTTELGAFTSYNDEVRNLLSRLAAGQPDVDLRSLALTNLDGRASSEFRRLVPLQNRRVAGTFFTNSALRTRAVAPYRRAIAAGAAVVDPACGLGDLLLAAADLIPSTWTPRHRVAHASANLHGRDLHAPLIEAAANRLAVWAAVAGTAGSAPEDFSVSVGDAFADDLDWKRFALVLLNPPYAVQRLQEASNWTSGSVTAAAPFTLDVLRRARAGANVAAILPDVLRSGTRYSKWRDEIEKIADLTAVDIVGKFDTWTDVDVFVAHFRRRGCTPPPVPARWYPQADDDERRLGDFASVSVGDVVPHRHVPSGPDSPYLTIDVLPAWATTLKTPQTIRHNGRLHQPPFVALRRTSAPTRMPGAMRTSAAVYAGVGPVAVENHLIIVRPNEGTVEACMRLLMGLRETAVTDWLDRRLRLRHLTVTALRELPARLLQEPGCDA